MTETIALTLNFRSAKLTLHCLESLWRNNIDHTLVWDNSEDDGQSAAELSKLIGQRDDVDILISPSNIGFAAAVNRATSLISERYPGSYILLINNDAEIAAGALRKLLTALGQNPNALFAYPDIKHGSRIIGTAYYHRLTGILQLHGKQLPGSFAYPSGCCMLIRSTSATTNLLDERFFMYGEDIELGYRLRQHPEMMAHVAQPLVTHLGSASSGAASEFYENRLVACHFLLTDLLMTSKTDRLLLISARWMMLGVRGVLRAVRYRSTSPLRALAQGWKIYRRERRSA